MATHSSILAWEIPWTEVPGGLQSVGLQRLDMTEHEHFPVHPNCLPFYVTTLASFNWVHNTTFWQHTLGLGWNCSG